MVNGPHVGTVSYGEQVIKTFFTQVSPMLELLGLRTHLWYFCRYKMPTRNKHPSQLAESTHWSSGPWKEGFLQSQH